VVADIAARFLLCSIVGSNVSVVYTIQSIPTTVGKATKGILNIEITVKVKSDSSRHRPQNLSRTTHKLFPNVVFFIARPHLALPLMLRCALLMVAPNLTYGLLTGSWVLHLPELLLELSWDELWKTNSVSNRELLELLELTELILLELLSELELLLLAELKQLILLIINSKIILILVEWITV